MSFKIDSDADVTTLDVKTYKSMVKPPDTSKTSDTLAGAGGEITCYGKFQTTTRSKDREYVIDVYVIDGSNLLGRTDASALGFIKFNRDPRAIAELTIDSDVFGTTGLVKTSPVNINICEGATPYHVNVARRVPIPLLPQGRGRIEEDGENRHYQEDNRAASMVCAEEAGPGQNMHRPQAAREGEG